jgi:hypothetical protein
VPLCYIGGGHEIQEDHSCSIWKCHIALRLTYAKTLIYPLSTHFLNCRSHRTQLIYCTSPLLQFISPQSSVQSVHPTKHFHTPTTSPHALYDCDPASAIAALFASETLLTSPCFPFCTDSIIRQTPCRETIKQDRTALTFHLANFNSISPLRSAANRLSSFRLRRTTRAATERYLL